MKKGLLIGVSIAVLAAVGGGAYFLGQQNTTPVPAAPPAPIATVTPAPAPVPPPVPVPDPAAAASPAAATTAPASAAAPAASPAPDQAAAPAAPPAPMPPVQPYEPGLIGTVYGPPIAPTTGEALWEYPLEGPRVPYLEYSRFAPSASLKTMFSIGLNGAFDITEAGQWGVRIRIEGGDKDGDLACPVSMKIEGSDVLTATLTNGVRAVAGTVSLPDAGLYQLAARFDCNRPDVVLFLETLPPGHTVWEPATVRHMQRPLASASKPTAASGEDTTAGGVQSITRGAAGGPKWLESVKAVAITLARDGKQGSPGNIGSAIEGDTVAQLTTSRADAISANTYPATRPTYNYDFTTTIHRTQFDTIQTVPKAGRWVYYIALEEPASAAIGACNLSMTLEGKPVFGPIHLGGLADTIGKQNPGSWAGIGVADLAAGDYKVTIVNDCVQGVPETIRVWVKGPNDKALRPLKAEEAGVKTL